MNKNRISCNDAALEASLLLEPSSEPSEELLTHVETCTRCQERLSDLAGPAAMWHGVKEAASESEITSSNQQHNFPPLNMDQTAIQWTDSMAKQLLSPPTHPEMLGRLGRYEVERLIGSGGMGVVFKAFDTELNRPVAIKLLAPYLASSGPARKRFSREARAAAAVVHQHVVPIHNVETERESPYIVMQYVSGESLQSRINRDGPFELCEILRIGMQVADGLSAAHQQGLVHRDIKPSNILLEEGVDRALISDFGLARAADDASLTRTGFHPGTPQYMSPEQTSGQNIDARSDLFSLGSMLYTMCTGRPPFRAENSLSVMRRIAESEPTPIRELNPNIPEWMCEVIKKLMAKDVHNRMPSATETKELLETFLRHLQQPLSISMPTLPWLSTLSPSTQSRSLKKGWSNLRTIALGAIAIALVVGLAKLSADLMSIRPSASNAMNSPAENMGLSQEVKSRLEQLVKDNSLIVVGKLQEGKPTGSAYAHLFEINRILKGTTAELNVLLSHKFSVNKNDPITDQNPALDLPRLNSGEYVIILRAEEVISSFRPINPLGFLWKPEPHFNYFIVRNAENHAAWPLGSPEEQYITSLFANDGNKNVAR